MSEAPEDATTDFGVSDRRRLEATRQIDTACDAYERAVASGELQPFGEFLSGVDEGLRSQLVVELVGVATEWMRDAGVSDMASELRRLNHDLDGPLLAQIEEIFAAAPTAQYEPGRDGQFGPRSGSGGRGSRGLQIRCPHCSNHVELISDAPLEEIDCTVCGSSFSLIDRSRETREAQTLKQIDRFELIARLGIGGFGTVWKARDTQLERAVAVKIPRRGQLTPDEIEQFLREARAAAQLSHPNIVPVHEVGREGDAVFIVSDLIRGVSLADRLTSGSPTLVESVRICIDIADALDHAHQRGIIHRDLKPSNVMMNDRGTPLLMDFGLAKREAEEVTMTTDGQIVGTPAYMSPEQASGRSAWVDRRSDIYSLGVILFELLTGELPFRGNAQMQIQQRQIDDAPNARTLNRHLPIDLATLCAKCLERDPGRRYPTASAVRDELQRYLERKPIQARPLSPIQRGARWAERNPAQALAAALVALLAIGGPTVAIYTESQRARLATLNAEKDDLITLRMQEAASARRENTMFREELDVWEGKANPWRLWPPKEAPNERLLASLLDHRGDQLIEPSDNESPRTTAMRRLSLGMLNEASNRPEEAARQYRAAVAVLEGLRSQSPGSSGIAESLLQAYDRLAYLAGDDEKARRRWMESAQELAESVAEASPEDAVAQAERLDHDLRSALAAGFEDAASQLESASAAERRLAEIWPTDTAELYRVTCALADAPAPLLALDEAASTPASD